MNNPIEDNTIFPHKLKKTELTGLASVFSDYKQDVLKLHHLHESADIVLEKLELERAFRKSITTSLYKLIDSACSRCPMGFTRFECKAKECPFKTIDLMLKDMLDQLEQVLPGGL